MKRNSEYCISTDGFGLRRLSIMIDGTDRCQLGCHYCYFGKKGNKNMNVDRVFQAVINLIPIFSNLQEVSIHYMGGEPLLAWKEIKSLNSKLQDYFISKNILFKWGLTSNLINLSKNITEFMIEQKASIHCSIDGPVDIQNKNRPFKSGKPSYERVVANIPNALRIQPNDLARVTVCPEDSCRLVDIADEIINRGFRGVGLFPVYELPWSNEQITIWAQQMSAAMHKYPGKIKTIIDPVIKSDADYFTFCGAGRGLYALDSNGCLFFCHHFTNTHKETMIIDATSANSQEIRNAIESSTLRPHKVKKPVKCQNCNARGVCSGGCWALNYELNGSYCEPLVISCLLKQELMRVVPCIDKLVRRHDNIDLAYQELNNYRCEDECDECNTCQECYGYCESFVICCMVSCDEELCAVCNDGCQGDTCGACLRRESY